MSMLSLYWGCWERPRSSIMRDSRGRAVWYPETIYPDFPWAPDLKTCGILRRWLKVDDAPDGRVHHAAGQRVGGPWWHAFLWWDRSLDVRPGSYSAFFIRGFGYDARLQAFSHACLVFPQVVDRQKHPLRLTPWLSSMQERNVSPAP